MSFGSAALLLPNVLKYEMFPFAEKSHTSQYRVFRKPVNVVIVADEAILTNCGSTNEGTVDCALTRMEASVAATTTATHAETAKDLNRDNVSSSLSKLLVTRVNNFGP